MITRTRSNTPFEKLKFWIFLSGLIFAGASPASELEIEADKPETGVYLVAEPGFLKEGYSEPIEGSRRTIRAVAEWTGSELKILKDPEVSKLQTDSPLWREEAVRRINSFANDSKANILRDPEGVVIGAVLDFKEPLAGGVLFSGSLVKNWEDVFGPEFYVAIPSRFRLYLFPKLATRANEFASAVLSDYRVSPHPVSPELFEVRSDGVRAIGELNDK